MTPHRQTDTLSVDQLSRLLLGRKISPTRFSVDLPPDQIARDLYAAYRAETAARCRMMTIDDDTTAHIREAAAWLADPGGRFGLLLQGSVGNGKTTLTRAICSLINYYFDSAVSTERRHIRFVKAKDLALMAADPKRRKEYDEICREEMLAIDDLGEDPAEISVYGTPCTPLRDLLELRYDRGDLTIVSTNLIKSAKDEERSPIAKHYGERVLDRLREMMHIITFRNPSYRAGS